LGLSEEKESELAHLELVPARQRSGIDPLTVQIGPVEGAHIMGREGTAVVPDFNMATRHRYIVQEHVALRMAADRYDRTRLRCQHVPGTRIWPARHHEDGATRRYAIKKVPRVEEERLRSALAR
jgi:hypothetical protein